LRSELNLKAGPVNQNNFDVQRTKDSDIEENIPEVLRA
jgi:hypothetical protein